MQKVCIGLTAVVGRVRSGQLKVTHVQLCADPRPPNFHLDRSGTHITIVGKFASGCGSSGGTDRHSLSGDKSSRMNDVCR